MPGGDAYTTLGSATNRWAQLFAATTTISTSDGRIKVDQAPIANGLGTLMRLTPKTYLKRRSHFDHGTLVLDEGGDAEAGFIAQDVAGILPTAVYRPEDDSQALWGLRYEQVIPYAVKAVQELKAENDELKARLAAVERQVRELLATVGRGN